MRWFVAVDSDGLDPTSDLWVLAPGAAGFVAFEHLPVAGFTLTCLHGKHRVCWCESPQLRFGYTCSGLEGYVSKLHTVQTEG